MKKILLIGFLIMVSSINIEAQVRTSISNLLRFGNGERTVGTLSNNFQYLENLTDVRFNLPENVTVGFRLLYDDPPEVGLPFQGLSRRFLEYRKENLSLRIGNSSELYGRGLVLNLFENRGLAYDTWIDGLKASYKYEEFTASIIAGTIEFTDSVNVYRTEKYKLRGGNFEYKFSKFAKLGFSFISSEVDIPQFSETLANLKSELPELYIELNKGSFNFFFNWANKWSNSETLNKSHTGSGIYSSFSYAGEKLGITVDYKNYRFDIKNPFLRNDETRASKFLPFQNPPIVIKEHSYTLLSRSIHEVNFNDEVGIQLDANYSVNEDLNFNLNFSLSSLHNSYFYNSDSFSFEEIKRDNNYLPSTDDKFSPFTEIFLEGEYYFDYNTALRFGIAHRTKTFYDDFGGIGRSHIMKSTVIPLQFQHPFTDDVSAVIQYEYEAVNDNFNIGQQNYSNQFISVITSIYSKLTASIRYEFTNNESDLSGKKDWLLGELGYRISGANLVSISYGRERGGQVCSNGICRYILPFKGFRLTLQTSL